MWVVRRTREQGLEDLDVDDVVKAEAAESHDLVVGASRGAYDKEWLEVRRKKRSHKRWEKVRFIGVWTRGALHLIFF